MKRLRSWWRAVTKRDALERDLDAEVRFHIDAYSADLTASGMSAEEAVRKAKMAFGSVEDCKDSARQSVGLRWIDELRNDLRYTLRTLLNSPGFTAIAILSLGLGIGANTTIFSLAKSVLLDKLAVEKPDELRLFGWWQPKGTEVVQSMWGTNNREDGGPLHATSFSYPVYRLLRANNPAFKDVFAFKPLGGYNRLTANIDASAETVTGELLSGNYYRALGVRTVLGREIGEADDREGSPLVAVISDGFWARRFGRSHDVIGKHIALNFVPVTIVGVNRPGFTGANSVQIAPDMFLPLASQPAVLPMEKNLLHDTDMWWVLVMGRVKTGASSRNAESGLQIALDKAVRTTMAVAPGSALPRAELLPGNRGLNSSASKAMQIKVLLTIVAFVLLLACSNIANLMLARAAGRRREFSMRLALGASRTRLVRQLMTESLALAFLGGLAGLLIGYGTRNLIPHFVNSAWERPELSPDFDFGVLFFTGAVSIIAGVLFGLAPAWSAAREDLYATAKDRGMRSGHGRKSRAGHALVVLQVALSLLLVVAAGLFVQTLANVQHLKLGFEPKNVLLFDVRPPELRYPGIQGQRLIHRIEEQLRAIPGIQSVGLSQGPLIANSMSNLLFYHPGEKRSRGGDHSGFFNEVDAGFFPTMRIPILAGRNFNVHDEAEVQQAAIVNLAFAKKFFPNSGALGKTLEDEPGHFTYIVGIAADAKYFEAKGDMPATAYLFYLQSKHNTGATFEVRTLLTTDQIAGALRQAVKSVDKDIPLMDMRTQIEQIEATRTAERLFANLASGFALLALAIAGVGVYGLMAFSVASRTNEIGIRMALGAQARQVLRLVLRETTTLAFAGVAVGLLGAIALSRLISSMLYGLKPGDPATLISATLLLLTAALVAAWIPARRAARIQPMQALRRD